jgi:hypothetical protein
LRGSRFAHVACADVNAGELVEPLYETLPLLVGSGKFVTPCERMHRAYARASLAILDVVEFDLDVVLLEPHPATVSALATARLRVSNRGMRWLYRWRDHTDATAAANSCELGRLRLGRRLATVASHAAPGPDTRAAARWATAKTPKLVGRRAS